MPDAFDILLSKVRQEMAANDGAPRTPAELTQSDIAQRLAFITSELDELIALSRDFDAPEIQQAIYDEAAAVGSVLARVQLLASFIDARKPAPRLVYRR